MTKHIQVQYQANGRAYTYEVPEVLQGNIAVGHAVSIEPTPQGTEWARVSALGSDYTGVCKRVTGIIDESEATAAEQEMLGVFTTWTGGEVIVNNGDKID